MRLSIFYASAALLALAACKKDEPKLETLALEPATAEVITDEVLAELKLTATPEGILDGKTITWTSDKPEIVAISEDGVLSLKVTDLEETQTVVITAAVEDKTATCTLTVKGLIARYEIIDMTSELGFKILDRNVGAKTADEVGNFYQWGKNTPVAANNDTDVNSSYDAEWSASSTGFADWSKPENTPCPKGWGLPTENQMKAIDDKTYLPYWGATDEEIAAVKALLDKMHLVNTGSFDKRNTTGKTPDTYVNFWSAVSGDNGNHWMFQYNNSDGGMVYIVKTGTPDLAIPVRCVKE